MRGENGRMIIGNSTNRPVRIRVDFPLKAQTL